MTSTRFFLYCRCASRRGTVTNPSSSIESQKRALLHYADQCGLQVIDTFIDTVSANAPRPAFERMLQRTSRGEAYGILTTDLSRLARSMTDMCRITSLMERGFLKEIRTTMETVTSPFLLSLSGLLFEYERHVRSVRIKRGLELTRRRRLQK